MKSYPTAVLNALESGRFAVRTMLRVDLASGAAGLWNDTYDVEFESVTYQALGGNMTADGIPGSTDMDADRVRIVLTGLDPDVLTLVDDAEWYQRPAIIYDVYLNESGTVMHVEAVFAGFLDTVVRSDAADETATIELSIESSNRELDRSSGRTYSDADQRAVGGADDGFLKHLVASTANTDIYWGRSTPNA